MTALLGATLLLGAQDLEQTIAAGQRVASERAVLERGHVDLGPRFVDGRWTVMIHDDAARAGRGESVWRYAERTVLRVGDEAILQVPDDPAYGFLPSKPGADVYVIPQTQTADVVWVGWNTQDPEAMETIDRGVTMTLDGVQGPGSLVVYLQSGDFAEPKVLWDSTADPQPVWVDVNTHTHANWVFSAPGVYLARVTIRADLVDGSTVTDARELRFAVGSRTSADAAFAAAWEGGVERAAATPTAVVASGGRGGRAGAAIALAAAAFAIAATTVAVRAERAKRRARSAP